MDLPSHHIRSRNAIEISVTHEGRQINAMTYKKKLIEVTLPLEGDQQESACKKMSGFGVIIVNML